MFEQNKPVFMPHHILHAKMLQKGFDGVHKLFAQLYQDYSEGILSGTKLSVTNNQIHISPGVVKYNGILYSMSEEAQLFYSSEPELQYLYLRFFDPQQKEDIKLYQSELVITKEKSEYASDLELGRFQLKDGALLRQSYQNLEDYLTPYNTLNILNAPYSTKNGVTISYEITKQFGIEMMKKPIEDPLDLAFSLECMKGEPISKEILQTYISRRLNRVMNGALSNEEIVRAFIEIMKSSTKRNHMIQTKDNRRIFID